MNGVAAMPRVLCVGLALLLVACGGSITQTKPDASAAAADPRAARVYLDGVKALQTGNAAAELEALSAFEQAVRIDPNLWEAHYNAGVVHRRRGELRKALASFDRAHSLAPAAGEPLLALAETRHALGERDGAGELLEEYVNAHPHSVDARVALTAVLRERGQYEAALTQARAALVRKPGNLAALLEVGRIYREKGDLDVAELVFVKALALDERSAIAHNDLGLLELARGDTQLAFEHFEKALAVDAAYVAARMNRASVLLRAGDYAAAHAEYEAVLSVDAQAIDARVGLGVALRGQGKHAHAEQAYQAALAQAPNHAAALFNLGVLRADFLDRRSEARELFERYLELVAVGDARRDEAERYVRELPEAEAASSVPARPAAATTTQGAAP